MLPIVLSLLLADQTPELRAFRDTASRMYEMTAEEEGRYEGASRKHLALARGFESSLRDWVEPQLPPPSATNERCSRISGDLRHRLQGAGIAGPNRESPAVQLEISRPAEYPATLLLRIGISIPYGVDEAAYLYEWRRGSWKRVFASERNQDDFGQSINELAFSPASPHEDHLIFTLQEPVSSAGCLPGVRYQLQRIGAKIDHTVSLLEGLAVMDICDHGHSLKMESNGFLLEFEGAALEAGFRRTHVLHYKVNGTAALRVSPVALQAQDFVHEWLERSWEEAENWSESVARGSLYDAHEELRNAEGYVNGEYVFVQHCQDPGRWQVAVDFKEYGTQYFLVREGAQYEFQMLDVSADRQEGCPGESFRTDEMPTFFGPKAH